jgi:DNA-binding GntR family transcriptional regulator
MVQHGTSQPPSRQLADLLRAQIVGGDLATGERVPSIVDLATEYHVTTGTVQKALRILKGEGLIVSVPSYGTFAAERGS